MVLDSDTLSYIINGRSSTAGEVSRQYLRVFRRFTVSVITLAEIIEGLVKVDDPKRIRAFLDFANDFEIISIGFEEAVLAGRILGALARTGQKIGDLDPFIAAIAIANGLPLVTNNRRHYQRIVDLGFSLELDSWRREA